MRKMVASCLLLVVSFSSCIIVNNCRGESNICEVHHKKMKRAVVGADFGLAAYGPDPSCPNAKDRLNVGCVVQPWPIYRLGIVYHCSVCDSIKNSIK